jgi:hypothetical protein
MGDSGAVATDRAEAMSMDNVELRVHYTFGLWRPKRAPAKRQGNPFVAECRKVNMIEAKVLVE